MDKAKEALWWQDRRNPSVCRLIRTRHFSETLEWFPVGDSMWGGSHTSLPQQLSYQGAVMGKSSWPITAWTTASSSALPDFSPPPLLKNKKPENWRCFELTGLSNRFCGICLQCRRLGFDPWVWSPGEKNGNPLQYSEFHGQRSLAGYSSWGCKESDRTKHACTPF